MNKNKLGLFIPAILAIAVSNAYSQDDELVDRSNDDLEEVIVTGVAGGAALKQDATFSINTLNSEEIARLAPISTADLLQNIPGIFAEGSSAGEASNNITVRGLPVTGGYRYAPQLIDGLPWFEEPEVQFMNNDTAARGDLMTERVEVVKGGVSGVLYSNGLGATVNHITRTGTQDFKGAYKLELADYGFVRHDAYVSGPINKSLTYAIGGYYRTSDGIRDVGYTADNGGQLRGNLKWLSDDDNTSLEFHFLTIDDKTAFYQNVPIQVPAFATRGTPENPIVIDMDTTYELGIDFAEGTVASPFNRKFTQLGEYGSREIDFADGLHADFDIFTVKARHNLNEHIIFNANLRNTSGTNDFNAMFTGNDSTSANRFLEARWQNDVVTPALGHALRGEFGAAKLAGFFNVPADAATAFNGISRDDFVGEYAKGVGVGAFYRDSGQSVSDSSILNFLLPFIANTDANSTSIDLNTQIAFDFLGDHTLTLGVYGAEYSVDQSFQGSLLASTMEKQSKLVDLAVVNADGEQVGPLLTLDGALLPGLFGYVSNVEADTKAFYINDHWETMDGRLKLDAGYRWQEQNSKVARLERNITEGSNFTPDGVVPGSVDDVTTADNEIFLPSGLREAKNTFDGSGWSIGANYSISSNFAVYGLISDSFRLPSMEDINEFRISDASDREQVEQISQYEAGIRYYADTWDTQIAVFKNEFSPRESSVQYRDFTSSDCVVNEGLADINTCPLVTDYYERGVENQGVELEFAWRPDMVEGFELRGNLVMQDPKIVGANYTVVNTVVENDVTVGYEFREIGESGRKPRRLADGMLNIQGVWDMKPIIGYPFKPYFKYTQFGERYSESSDFDVTLYPEYFHVDAGFIYDFDADMSLQFHVSNITDELSFTEGDPLIVALKGPNGATNRGVARPLFGRTMRAMFNYRF